MQERCHIEMPLLRLETPDFTPPTCDRWIRRIWIMYCARWSATTLCVLSVSDRSCKTKTGTASVMEKAGLSLDHHCHHQSVASPSLLVSRLVYVCTGWAKKPDHFKSVQY